MTVDRTRPPASGLVRPFRFPDWQGHQLANGLRLMVVPQSTVPLVHLELLFDEGADTDPLDRRGLTAMAAGLLDEGTAGHSSTEIADSVELLGAALYSTGDWDGVYVGVSSLSQHLHQLFPLIAEIARQPAFPSSEVERLRAMRLADLTNRARQPAFAAGRRALEVTYGDDHPYGSSLSGTATGLESITQADLTTWHRARAQPQRATLIAVGDTDLDSIAVLAERHFGDWERGAQSDAAPPTAVGRPRQVSIVDRPSASQTELRLVRVGPPRGAADYLAARLVNLIFGGKFTSRLNLNLREERGITYSVHSRLSGRRGSGPFTIACAVDNDSAGLAVGEILREMDRLATEPPSPAEAEDARNYLLGTFPYRLQALEGVADHLGEIALHGLADDHYQTLPAAVTAVSAEAMAGAARGLLTSADLAIVAAGPASSLSSQLEPFGPLESPSQAPQERLTGGREA